jgi:hypothetical protein
MRIAAIESAKKSLAGIPARLFCIQEARAYFIMAALICSRASRGG